MATPLAKMMLGGQKFNPQLEADTAAHVYARDAEEARALLDDALDYVDMLTMDLVPGNLEDLTDEQREERQDWAKMASAAMNLANAALEYLEEQANA